jgi:hypothetical protein
MKSYYKNGFAKPYVRNYDLLRTETATNNVYKDYRINKALENLGALRQKLRGITTVTRMSSRILRRYSEVSNPCFPKLATPSDLTAAVPGGMAMMIADARAPEKTLFHLSPLVPS